jgi:hypothetical protein
MSQHGNAAQAAKTNTRGEPTNAASREAAEGRRSPAQRRALLWLAQHDGEQNPSDSER